MRSPWAKEYVKSPNEYVWGTDPSSFARRVAELAAPGGRVLDLGCGEGRDSVFFAAHGLDVTGVDASRAGIAKARRLAGSRGVRIRWLVGDMARLRYDGHFDVVYSLGGIHYVPRRLRNWVFLSLKSLTHPGGIHAYVVFTDREIYVEKGEVIDYFAPGELSAQFVDWLTLDRKDGRISCDRDGTPHHHSVEFFIVRATAGAQTRIIPPSTQGVRAC
ncbi:MAG: class I SAM-dependent methyltransferase [Candidatus Methylomirabilia bacterium]